MPVALGGFARGVTPETELDPRQMLQIALAQNKLLVEENAGLRGEVAGLKRDLRHLGDTASSISSVALSLLKMLLDKGEAAGPREVVIPEWLHRRMLGASIRVGNEPDGSVRVQLRDEGHERVVPTL